MTRVYGVLLMLVSCAIVSAQEPNPPLSLSPEQEEAAISYLTKDRGFESAELERLKAANIGEYRQMLARAFQESRELAELEVRDPEMYARVRQEHSLDAKIRELAKKYRKTSSEPGRKELRAQVKQLVAQQFDLREGHRKDEIKRLEQELSRLKEVAPERMKHKTEIVARHVDELLGDADLYAW